MISGRKYYILLGSMKIKQTIIAGVIVLISLFSAHVFVGSQLAYAKSCGGVDTTIIECKAGPGDGSTDPTKTAIWEILIQILNIMTAGVGILAVAGIAWAAVLYSSAGDSAEQVKKAKSIITNVVIGLVAFGLLYTVSNYLIPGGIFNA